MIKKIVRNTTPPFIYQAAHRVKNLLLHQACDICDSSTKPLVHNEIYDFVHHNRSILENGNFVLFPNNDNSRQFLLALNELHLFDSERFKYIDAKSEWNGGISIKIGSFGDKSEYEYISVIYAGDYRYELEEFLLWNRDFNTSRILIMRSDMIHGQKALQKVLEFPFQTVLDIGCGYGMQSKFFADLGFSVTGITYPEAEEGRYTGDIIKDDKRVRFIIGDYTTYELNEKYDLVWACHVMEHIVNISLFIQKIKDNVKPGGIIAITVPNDESNASLLHLHKFNAGFILRNLLYSGINCRTAKVFTYNYNLSIVIPNVSFFKWCHLREIFDYLPPDIEKIELHDGNIFFNGNITKLNWE